MLICYTKVPKKFYSLRTSFYAETCERPILSGVVTASNSETLMADVLSFLTMGKWVVCQRWASGLKVFRSQQLTEKNTVRRMGVVQPYLLLEEKKNLKIF